MNAATGTIESLVEIEGLSVTFPSTRSAEPAVDDVSFSVRRGEVLGLLGESGSGKSMTLRAMMRLLPSGAQASGSVRVCGHDMLQLPERRLQELRGPVVSMVFQEPITALDPVFTLGAQISEMIRRHDGCSRREAEGRALELFTKVRIPSPKERLKAYPHELSGGMRQRAMIALALCCRPKVLLADEPTTALDVTVQMQIILLLRELQSALDMSMVFVTHDIGVAIEIADRVAVMRAGRIVEVGSTAEVIGRPKHPYTRELIASGLGEGTGSNTADIGRSEQRA